MTLRSKLLWISCLFQLQLMKKLRESIAEDRLNLTYWDWITLFLSIFPDFLPLYKISSTNCSPPSTLLLGLARPWPVLELSFFHDWDCLLVLSELIWLSVCLLNLGRYHVMLIWKDILVTDLLHQCYSWHMLIWVQCGWASYVTVACRLLLLNDVPSSIKSSWAFRRRGHSLLYRNVVRQQCSTGTSSWNLWFFHKAQICLIFKEFFPELAMKSWISKITGWKWLGQ